MKRIIGIAAAVAMATTYFVSSALPAYGNESGTVNAKVAVASPCITVALANNATEMNFGTMTFTTPQQTSFANNGVTTVTNCGAGSESVSVRGTNATGPSGATWTLLGTYANPCTPGAEKNVYSVGVIAMDQTNTSISDLPLTNAAQQLYTAAASASNKIVTGLKTPCTGSDGAGETMSFQIIYTASL